MSALLSWTGTELPLFFEANGDELFGVLSMPSDLSEARNIAVVVLASGGTPVSTGVNDFSVRICRRAAALGFHAFRFDYHGVGESSGVRDRFDLAHPFTADLEAALDELESIGLRRSVLIGECFGARTAISLAASSRHDVAGVLALCPPIRDFEMGERVTTRIVAENSSWTFARKVVRLRTLRRAFGDYGKPYARIGREKLRSMRAGRKETDRYHVSERFLDPMQSLATRDVRLMVVYGEQDDFFADLQRAESSVAALFGTDSSDPKLVTLPGHLHGLDSVSAQFAAEKVICEWLEATSEVLGS